MSRRRLVAPSRRRRLPLACDRRPFLAGGRGPSPEPRRRRLAECPVAGGLVTVASAVARCLRRPGGGGRRRAAPADVFRALAHAASGADVRGTAAAMCGRRACDGCPRSGLVRRIARRSEAPGVWGCARPQPSPPRPSGGLFGLARGRASVRRWPPPSGGSFPPPPASGPEGRGGKHIRVLLPTTAAPPRPPWTSRPPRKREDLRFVCAQVFAAGAVRCNSNGRRARRCSRECGPRRSGGVHRAGAKPALARPPACVLRRADVLDALSHRRRRCGRRSSRRSRVRACAWARLGAPGPIGLSRASARFAGARSWAHRPCRPRSGVSRGSPKWDSRRLAFGFLGGWVRHRGASPVLCRATCPCLYAPRGAQKKNLYVLALFRNIRKKTS